MAHSFCPCSAVDDGTTGTCRRTRMTLERGDDLLSGDLDASRDAAAITDEREFLITAQSCFEPPAAVATLFKAGYGDVHL